MAFTPDDLTVVDQAIASSKLTVKYADRLVTYRSMDELIKAKTLIEEELAATSNTPIRRQIRIVSSSGW